MARSLDDIISSIPARDRWKLDEEIDFENKNTVTGDLIPKHFGRIADRMTNWEGLVADNLDLSDADRFNIKEHSPTKPELQRLIKFIQTDKMGLP